MAKRSASDNNTNDTKRIARSAVTVVEDPEIIVIDSSSEDEEDVDTLKSNNVDTPGSDNADSSEMDNVEDNTDTSRSDHDPLKYKMQFNEEMYYDIQVEKRVSSDEKVLKRFEKILDGFNQALKDRVPNSSDSVPYDVDEFPIKKFGGVVGLYIQFLAFNGFSEFDTGVESLKEYLGDLVTGSDYYSKIMPDLNNHLDVLAAACSTILNSKIKNSIGNEQNSYFEAHSKGTLDYLDEAYGFSQTLDKINNSKRPRQWIKKQTSLLKEHTPDILAHQYNLTGSPKNTTRDNALNGIMDLLLSVRSHLRGESKRELSLMDISYKEKYQTKRGYPSLLTLNIRKDYGESSDDLPKVTAVTRHKNPLLCLVTAIAFSMWYTFDMRQGRMSKANLPDFYDSTKFNLIKLLYNTKTSLTSSIDLLDHHEITLNNLQAGGFKSDYRTSDTRKAFPTDANLISLEYSKIHGVENIKGAKKEVISEVSLQFLMYHAGFTEDESYHISRDEVKPPESLVLQIFPWIEGTIKQHEKDQKKTRTTDISVGERFLQLLVSLRPVILQDLAIMSDLIPDSIFARHPIAKNSEFLKFKEQVKKRLESAEESSSPKPTSNVMDQHMAKEIESIRSEATQTSQSLERSLACVAKEVNQIMSKKAKESGSRTKGTMPLTSHSLLESLDILESMTTKFKSIEAKVEGLEGKINKMETKIDRLDRVDKMESKLDVIIGVLQSSQGGVENK